jgi:hypothetical protein
MAVCPPRYPPRHIRRSGNRHDVDNIDKFDEQKTTDIYSKTQNDAGRDQGGATGATRGQGVTSGPGSTIGAARSAVAAARRRRHHRRTDTSTKAMMTVWMSLMAILMTTRM